jgi:hypothetical protein
MQGLQITAAASTTIAAKRSKEELTHLNYKLV